MKYLSSLNGHAAIARLTILVTTSYLCGMKKTAPPGNPKHPTAPAEEAVFLDLMRTADMLSRGLVSILKAEDLSPTQYNVLRILRGSPEGLSVR